ncbi:carbohydrate binding domain-containing protein [Microcella sp.]|uniref:carbohydrate binding domain-containing protein n=1 Tax=Microcella sp. TaxID=1913979 RepID=UPI00391D5AE7
MSHRTRTFRRRTLATVAAGALLAPIALGMTPAVAATTAVIADYDTVVPSGGFEFGDAGSGIVEIPESDTRAKPGQSGTNRALSYGWTVNGSFGFGGIGYAFDTPQDFSVFDGIRFSFRGAGDGEQFRFEISDGSAGNPVVERFDYVITDDVAPAGRDDNGWRTVELSWADFQRSSFFQEDGAPNDGFGLDLVQAIAFPAITGEQTILLDDIELFSADDLAPAVTITPATATVVEGGTVTLDVVLGFATGDDVTVAVDTADGTATAGDDYVAVSETVTIPAGSTRASVSVTTIDDDLAEDTETFTVTISDPVNATLGTTVTATVQIIDNDGEVVGPPAGRTQLVDDMEAPLDQGRDGTIDIGWLQAQDGGTTMSYGQSTTPPAPVPGSDEGNTVLRGTFAVNAFGVVVRAFPNDALDTWVTQDWSTFEGMGFWMYGNGTGTSLFVDVIDNRTPDSTRDDAERFSVAFSDDWTGWRFLTFNFDDFTRKEIGNGAPNDGFTLTEIHGYAIGALRTPGEVTYYVDDVLLYGERAEAPLAVAFDRAGYVVTEGDDATAIVRLNRVTDEDVTVDFEALETTARTATEDLSATANRDFVPTSGTVTIPAGEQTATITVPTIDDDKWEVDETFIIRLSNPSIELGRISTATVSIRDNDEKDPFLIDDFESFPWLLDVDGGALIDQREIASTDPDAVPGQGAFEGVLDIDHAPGSGITRSFPASQDWSSADGLTFWHYATEGEREVTVGLTTGSVTYAGTTADDWELAWSDEFDGPAGARANPENWTYETGGWGWGNDEFQYYTDSTDNAALDGEGNLVITVREVDPATTELECWYGPCTHTSARLITEGKQEFQYGRMESRVMVPGGTGIWPAVWSLGTDFREVGWPQTGEIDIMEFVGRLPNEIFGTIHGPGYAGGQSFGNVYDFGEPVPGRWLTFTVDWTPEEIVWYVEGIEYHRATPADVAPNEWVFEHPFSLLTNVAVGGNFGGPLGDDLELPASMLVDYVRVYQAPPVTEQWEATVEVDGAGWQQVVVPFSAFGPVGDVQPAISAGGLTAASSHVLDASAVLGYAFTFAAAGETSIDQIALTDVIPAEDGAGDDGSGDSDGGTVGGDGDGSGGTDGTGGTGGTGGTEQADAGSATPLPRTGAEIGGLIALALALLGLGGLAAARAAQRRRGAIG